MPYVSIYIVFDSLDFQKINILHHWLANIVDIIRLVARHYPNAMNHAVIHYHPFRFQHLDMDQRDGDLYWHVQNY